MGGLMDREHIPAIVWREKENIAILESVEVAVRVLKGRRLTEAQKTYALDLAIDLIELAKGDLDDEGF
jgi:hypothetical protein